MWSSMFVKSKVCLLKSVKAKEETKFSMKRTQAKNLLIPHEVDFEDIVENLEPTGFESCCVGSGDVLAEVNGDALDELINDADR